MNKLKKHSIFEENLSTLKETSKDNHNNNTKEFMTNS